MATRFERLLEAGLRVRPNETRRTALMAAYAANAIGAVVVGRSVRDALYLTHRPATGLGPEGQARESDRRQVNLPVLRDRRTDQGSGSPH